MCPTIERMKVGCVYQLEEGESFGPLTVKAMLTTTAKQKQTSVQGSEGKESAVKEKQTQTTLWVKLEFPPVCNLQKIPTWSVWESKSTASGRFYYCSSHQVSVGKEPSD